jgi:hypothetical protein
MTKVVHVSVNSLIENLQILCKSLHLHVWFFYIYTYIVALENYYFYTYTRSM